MPWGAVAGAVTSWGLGQLSGGSGQQASGGSAGAPADHTYVGTARPQMDANFQNAYGQYQNQVNQNQTFLSPFAQSTFNQQWGNPYAQYMQGAANTASGAYMGQGNQNVGGSGALFGSGNQLLQNSMDPRGDIYRQNVAQLQDNTRAAEYARGIQSSPYGAAVEGNVMGQFQNDWQNQQLQREIQGLRGAESAFRGGSSLGALGAQQYQTGGQIPYATQNQITGDQNSAISQYWQNMQPYLSGLNQLQSNALGYNNNANSAANLGFQNSFQQQQANANAIGQIAGPLGNAVTSSINNWWNQPNNGMGTNFTGDSAFNQTGGNALYGDYWSTGGSIGGGP